MLSTVLLATLGITGVSFLGLGFFLGFSPIILDIIHKEITKQTQLENGTEQWERWEELPFPLIFNVYAFNVTNPKEIVEEGAKPKVQQVGPFAYKQYYHKIKIKYSEDDDTLTYENHIQMVFDSELSALSDDTNITVINLPLMGTFQNDEETPNIVIGVGIGHKYAFHDDGIFITLPAKNYFLEGYDFCEPRRMTNGLLALDIGEFLCKIVKIVATINPTLKVMDDKIKFSFFAHKNNHTDGVYKISAGIKDINTLGQILAWNSDNKVESWVGDECNQIRGTDAAIYAPFNNQSSTFYSFSTDLCRSPVLHTVGKDTYKDIEGVLAIMGPENMKNSGKQSCYCIKKTRNIEGEFECLPDGFADMGTCINAPVLVSYPHMLWADKSYASSVEGMEPDEKKHVTYVLLEPNTGTPLRGRKRVQFNMIIRPIPGIPATQFLPRAVMPAIWVEEVFDLPDKYANIVKDGYINKMALLDAITLTMIGTGSMCAIGSVAYFIFPRF